MKTELALDYQFFKTKGYKKLKSKIVRYEDFDDVYNLVFARFFQHPEKYSDGTNKLSYITTAVYNEYRNLKTIRSRSFNCFNTNCIEFDTTELVHNEEYDKNLDTKQLTKLIIKIIEDYPEKQKRAIICKLNDTKIPGHYESGKTAYRLGLLKLQQDMWIFK